MYPELVKTVDGEFIEVRKYLCSEKAIFVKLDSDIVMLIDDDRSGVYYLITDNEECFNIAVESRTSKPRFGHSTISFNASGLNCIQKNFLDSHFKREFFYDSSYEISELELYFSNSEFVRNRNSRSS